MRNQFDLLSMDQNHFNIDIDSTKEEKELS
jgi:hypothetical protein